MSTSTPSEPSAPFAPSVPEQPERSWRLLDAARETYESSDPGTLGGHRRGRSMREQYGLWRAQTAAAARKRRASG